MNQEDYIKKLERTNDFPLWEITFKQKIPGYCEQKQYSHGFRVIRIGNLKDIFAFIEDFCNANYSSEMLTLDSDYIKQNKVKEKYVYPILGFYLYNIKRLHDSEELRDRMQSLPKFVKENIHKQKHSTTEQVAKSPTIVDLKTEAKILKDKNGKGKSNGSITT